MINIYERAQVWDSWRNWKSTTSHSSMNESHLKLYFELLLTALIVGILRVLTAFSPSLVLSASLPTNGIAETVAIQMLAGIVGFVVVPVVVFIAVYFIALGANADLTKTYIPIIGSLFGGAAAGVSTVYAALAVSFGVNFSNSNVSSFAYLVTGIGVIDLSYSLEIVFVGFTAITLQFILSGKLTASLK